MLNKTGTRNQVSHVIKLSAFETFAYMTGKFKDDYLDYSTSGFEVSTKGIIKYLKNYGNSGIFKFINDHFEIVYSHVSITNGEYPDLNFSVLNLRINNFNF